MPALPLIAVNTTAGTASETTRAYVIVNEETGEKFGSRDQYVIPAVAVDDHQPVSYTHLDVYKRQRQPEQRDRAGRDPDVPE